MAHVIRPFKTKDVPEAMHLLAESQKKFYVHTVRGEQIWRMQHETSIASDPEPFEAYSVEKKGKMVAYFRMRENPNDKELMVTEITDVDYDAARSILRFLKDEGAKRGLATLVALMSYQESFSEHMNALGAERRIPPYAWQVRISDYVRIFQKLKPLFETRLASSTYRGLTEELNFNFRGFTIKIKVDDGLIEHVKRIEDGERSPIGMNPLVFVQLLLGHRSRSELEMAFPDFRVDVSHKHMIDVLFPKSPSFIHSAY
jgi:hypothetical protein